MESISNFEGRKLKKRARITFWKMGQNLAKNLKKEQKDVLLMVSYWTSKSHKNDPIDFGTL
jgi:hypothetical protein